MSDTFGDGGATSGGTLLEAFRYGCCLGRDELANPAALRGLPGFVSPSGQAKPSSPIVGASLRWGFTFLEPFILIHQPRLRNYLNEVAGFQFGGTIKRPELRPTDYRSSVVLNAIAGCCFQQSC